jgi:hypothetical protein
MKTHTTSKISNSLAVALALTASAALLHAGPPPGFYHRATPITTAAEADAIKPDDTVMLVCAACKTVDVTQPQFHPVNGKLSRQLFTVGSIHKCGHCGGMISVVQGKTADSMQHNCSMCGEGAVFCCAVPASPEKN